METDIVVAIISMVGACIGGLCVAIPTIAKVKAENSAIHAVIEIRMNNIEAKLEKHNSMVERTYKLENDTLTSFRRIDELRDELRDLREQNEKR